MKSAEFQTADSLSRILDAEAIIEETAGERININSFRGATHFDNDEIDADLHLCLEIEGRISNEKKEYTPEKRAQFERGLAAEYTFRHAIAEHGWLAENVNVIVTSKYDDYVRGIDSIAQIIMGPDRFEHLGFAIDFAASADDVGEKIRRTFDSLDQGFTPSVKYFDSQKTGKLRNFKIPRLVIGSGHESLERLAAYSAEIANGSSISDSVMEEIKNDPFRAILFGEIEAQLSVYINRLQHVVEQAKKYNRKDIESRATNSLSIHKKALITIQELADEANIEMETIRKHIRGDQFANKMAQALSTLSMTPIVFK